MRVLQGILSRAEEITSEVRKLVLTCRAMEAQLQQSMPKKTHQEIVAKMQGQIDNFNVELERTKAELKSTTTVGDRVDNLASQVSTENESLTNLVSLIGSQSQVLSGLDTLVNSQKNAIEGHSTTLSELTMTFSKEMAALETKLSRDTVPVLLYNQTLAKIGEIEERMRFMVERADYTAVQKRCDELTERLSNMVPTVDYLALQKKCDELGERIAIMVPASDYDSIQSKCDELSERMTSMIPMTDYSAVQKRCDDLAQMITTMVPSTDYNAVQKKCEELSERLTTMVPYSDYATLQTKCDELSERMTKMVPATEYFALQAQFTKYVPKAQYEELQGAYANTVPREQYTDAQKRVNDLEAKLAQSVPKSDYDELTAKIASITSSITTSDLPLELTGMQEPPASEPTQVVQELEAQQVVEAPVQESNVVPTEEAIEAENKVEISEVQSNLSEIKSESETGATFLSIHEVDATHGFIFARTTYCARSGMEFLNDLERVPTDVLEAHSRNGDFERWFRDVLQDIYSADSFRAIRENGSYAGEELRTHLVAAVAQRYKS